MVKYLTTWRDGTEPRKRVILRLLKQQWRLLFLEFFVRLENNAGLSTELKVHITYNDFTNRCMSIIDIYSVLSAFIPMMYYPSKLGRNSYRVEKVTGASTIEISSRKTQLFC